jgi:hypothetical protein
LIDAPLASLPRRPSNSDAVLLEPKVAIKAGKLKVKRLHAAKYVAFGCHDRALRTRWMGYMWKQFWHVFVGVFLCGWNCVVELYLLVLVVLYQREAGDLSGQAFRIERFRGETMSLSLRSPTSAFKAI